MGYHPAAPEVVQVVAALELLADDGVVQAAEEGFAEIGWERCQAGHGIDGWGQSFHFDTAQTGLFHMESGEDGRDRAVVRRIEIKVRGEDGEALRIGRFHDQNAAFLQLFCAIFDEFWQFQRG